ncbi:IS5 family transposase [Corallococcus llansteffanensis]|uniref:IS5 family transposase n=1 Tax=Corallococcus llansteffanensis TaxID=2316731 RepID=A0A3A8PZN5_9BACT|nr:IS5 family transposase [Corallococcus llansteffanensis]RKH56654.1 IS5 family transposase [Corallococcus llansteffanensis]
MARELVPDALWERVAPLVPVPKKKKLGRPRANERAALEAIVFVFRTGIAWEMLPAKQFGLSGMTAWRRLEQWTRAGVFEQLQRVLLNEMGQRSQVDFSRASLDSSSVRAKKGVPFTGKNPTDRAKAGSKHHLLVDRKGLPLAESLTGPNVHDTHELFPLLDAMPDVKHPRGRPRHRPGKLHADKAYSSRKNCRGLRRRGITARIARPGIESKHRLGRHRWVVERTNAWINQLQRLRVRDERQDDVHFALLVLGSCLILFRSLQA